MMNHSHGLMKKYVRVHLYGNLITLTLYSLQYKSCQTSFVLQINSTIIVHSNVYVTDEDIGEQNLFPFL